MSLPSSIADDLLNGVAQGTTEIAKAKASKNKDHKLQQVETEFKNLLNGKG